MIFEVMEIGDGERIEGPTGKINVYLEPVKSNRTVHIKSPGDDIDDDDLCRVHGQTYKHKDKIKKLPYGDEGTKWTGEVWTVYKGMVTDLCAVLKIAGIDVTVESGAVRYDEDWGDLRNEIELPGDDNETLEIYAGPEAPGDKVSRSWAEDAAETGNYESVEAFAARFNLEIASDEEMKEVIEESGGDINEFSSDDAKQFG